MRWCLLWLMLLAPGPVLAQGTITLVVNFVAGGPSDLMARLLAPELSQALGTPVVVKNSAGAAGGIGAAEVARARPDGLTLLLSPIGAMAIQPHFRADLPYRPADFAPVCQIADTPVVMMAPPRSPLRGVAAVVARAREAGSMNYASTGPGSLPHISTVAFARATGIAMTHVPFRGNAEAVTALLRGDVAVFADQPGTLRANDLQAVGIMAERRVPEFPDTPTFREQGVDLVFSIWSGIFAPAGVAEATLARMEAACERALRAPAVVEGFARLLTPILYRDRTAFAGFWARELESFRAIVQGAGLRPGD